MMGMLMMIGMESKPTILYVLFEHNQKETIESGRPPNTGIIGLARSICDEGETRSILGGLPMSWSLGQYRRWHS
jgi:hypothetical protein